MIAGIVVVFLLRHRSKLQLVKAKEWWSLKDTYWVIVLQMYFTVSNDQIQASIQDNKSVEPLDVDIGKNDMFTCAWFSHAFLLVFEQVYM